MTDTSSTLLIEIDFEISQQVYLKTDTDQFPRLVSGYCVRPNNEIQYALLCLNSETWHWAYEISTEKIIF